MDSGKLLAAGRFCDCNLAINSHTGRRWGSASCLEHVASSGTDRPGSTIPGGERSASIAPPTPATRTTSTCRFDHPLNAIPSDAPTKRISEPSTTHTNVVCASYAAIGNEIEESRDRVAANAERVIAMPSVQNRSAGHSAAAMNAMAAARHRCLAFAFAASSRRHAHALRLDVRREGCNPIFQFTAGKCLATHRTIVNRRLQRSDPGQRHTCQACVPSPTEKKMISARPMMFSNGT